MLDEALTLRSVIKLLFTIYTIIIIYKDLIEAVAYNDLKLHKKLCRNIVIIIINIIFIWWLWS